jgi:general stress protein YciG
MFDGRYPPSEVNVRRGFGLLSPEKRRELASKGGKAVPASKRSFSMDKGVAKQAGQKGGNSGAPRPRNFGKDRELAREAGKLGGEKRRK